MNGVRVQQRRLESALPWLAVTLGLALLTAVLIATPRTAWAATTTETFDSSTTWTVPGGVTSVTVEMWGAGGGGGAGAGAEDLGGGGGGGGAYARATMPVVGGQTYSLTVGTAGSGGTAGQGGGGGGASSLTGPVSVPPGASGAEYSSRTLTAGGGSGGRGALSAPNPAAEGVGGQVTHVGSVLEVVSQVPGAPGDEGDDAAGGGGGGAGGLGSPAPLPATGPIAGVGGGADPSKGGNGGAGQTGSSAGGTGFLSGGGGGGGGPEGGVGGAGGAGRIRITWTSAVPGQAQSTIQASPAEVEADDVKTSTITVTVKDASSASVHGALVTLSPNPSGGVTIVENTGVYTNSTGVATFTVKRDTPGQVTFTATIQTGGNSNVTKTVNVNFVEVGPPGCESPKVAHETFAPALASSGVTISIWGGGRLSEMPTAVSYWTTYNGAFVGYIPGVGPGLQQTVNGEFLSRYGTDLPPCLGFVVRR